MEVQPTGANIPCSDKFGITDFDSSTGDFSLTPALEDIDRLLFGDYTFKIDAIVASLDGSTAAQTDSFTFTFELEDPCESVVFSLRESLFDDINYESND